MFGRCTITPVAPDYVDKLAEKMKQMEGQARGRRPRRGHSKGQRGKGFRRHEIPPSTPRGLFTVFLDEEGQSIQPGEMQPGQMQIGQVWASSPASAASLMAPWAKDRLRRARKASEVPVELMGWDDSPGPAELSEKSGIPENDLDAGLTYGTELCNVWVAEHTKEGREQSLYIIETIPMGSSIEPDGY